MVYIKKEAGVGSSPSIASLSNIDIYTIWGMMGKPISRGGGIIWRRPKQHIRYYGVFLLILIIFFHFPAINFSEMSNIYGCKEMGKLRSVSMRACYIGSGGHPDDGNPQICRIAANIRLTIQRHKPLYSPA